MNKKEREKIFVRGSWRDIVMPPEYSEGEIPYFNLEDNEFALLQQKTQAIKFPLSQSIPIDLGRGTSQLQTLSVYLAKALELLYQDKELRKQAYPPHLQFLTNQNTAIMSHVGFDFLVGPHLERPILLEVACFGPEFTLTAMMAEFFRMLDLEHRLKTWFYRLVKECFIIQDFDSKRGGLDLYYITRIKDFDFTREKEHVILLDFLQEQGLKVDCGPAENKRVLDARAIYLRAGVSFSQVWEPLKDLAIWQKIKNDEVINIPPVANTFFNSKVLLPILADVEEMTRRGLAQEQAELISQSMPATALATPGNLKVFQEMVSPNKPLFLKGVWGYGGYRTRYVYDSQSFKKALREIGDMPIIIQTPIKSGFIPFSANTDDPQPDRQVEVRVMVFDHEGTIKCQPPSARVYLPGSNFPMSALYLSRQVLPKP